MVKKGGLNTHGHWVLLLLILSLALYIVYISRMFILPLMSAAIFSFVSYPLYQYLVSKIHKPRMSAVYLIFILTSLVLIPILLAFSLVAWETIDFVNNAPEGMLTDMVTTAQGYLGNLLGIEFQEAPVLELGGERFKSVLLSASMGIINGISKVLFQIAFIIIFMYYFYLYGPALFEKFHSILPFSKRNRIIFTSHIRKDIQALFLGQGLVAFIQGILGGIGFLIAGIPNLFLWSFMMIIASFLPVVGAWLIWFPAVLYLLLNGAVFQGFFLLIWGIFVVSNIDNVLRPFIVNTMSKIDFLVVLVGVIIGVKTFNLIGIVVGPLLISILIALIKIYYEETLEDSVLKKVHKKIKKLKKV